LVLFSQKNVLCSSSFETVYFNFKMTPHLNTQVEVEDSIEKTNKTSKTHLKKQNLITHYIFVLIENDSAEL